MRHQWQQFSHHSEKQCLLTDDEERELIKAWSQSSSFDDVIIEAQHSQNVRQGI